MTNRTDGRPRHQQIAAELRARIMSGDVPPGSQLPSTQHLVTQYETANATIQRALGMLKDEGFLHSRVGKGVYVRESPTITVEAIAYIAPSPSGYSYQLLRVEEVQPPADVARALDHSPGDTAVLRHRLLRRDGHPVELSWSYYPTHIAQGTDLSRRAKITGGAPRVLADLGMPQRVLIDRCSVRLPTTEELEALELPDDVPVIRQLRVIYSDDRRPVEVSVLVKGGHRFELQYQQNIQALPE